jgi:hypothetical protein
MTEHLPECPSRCTEQAFCGCLWAECICDRLRACADRVTAAAVQRVEAHLIMLDDNGWRATLNGEGYSDLAGFGPGVIAVIKGDQP